jgi:hypothetical protein
LEFGDIQFYREQLLTEQNTAQRLLIQLARTDHERFLAICSALLGEGSEIPVQQTVFSLLGQYGQRDDFAEEKALDALHVPELETAALLALGRVGSAKSVPILFRYAEQGVAEALVSLHRLGNRFPLSYADEQKLVQLARAFVFSQDFYLIDVALGVLLRHSSIDREEQLLLQAAQKNYHEGILDVLGSYATPAVLPGLRAMLSRVSKGYVEFTDTSDAIEQITRRFNLETT